VPKGKAMGFAKAQPILRAGGIDAKQRPVWPPRLRRILVEPVTDEGEQLGRLVDHGGDEVCQREERQQDCDGDRDPNDQRRARELQPRPARAPSPAAEAREEAGGFCGHVLYGLRACEFARIIRPRQ